MKSYPNPECIAIYNIYSDTVGEKVQISGGCDNLNYCPE